MTSAVASSSRGYRPISQSSPTLSHPTLPMPAPISRIALAARQNQIIAPQALQAAATTSNSSSSSSSSSPGSPPLSVGFSSSLSTLSNLSHKRGRKFQACRALTSFKNCTASQKQQPASSNSAANSIPLITTTTPYWAAQGSLPLIDPTSGYRSEIYSLTNDRYPGAPGTALAKAREAQQKAIQLAKREAARKLASKAELEHLGVKGLGKKRKSSSPYATVSASTAKAPSSNERTGSGTSRESASTTRGRSAAAAASANKPAASAAATTSTTTTTTTTTSANDSGALQVPTSSRSRRPASRSKSPSPLTSQTTGRRSQQRATSTTPNDDEHSKTTRATRPSPSRGSSPPEGVSKSHHGPLSNAPFQSSPLAASSMTLEPSADLDEAGGKSNPSPSVVISSEPCPSASQTTTLKRKASALSQQIQTDHEADAENKSSSADPTTAATTPVDFIQEEDEPSKKLKADDGAVAANKNLEAREDSPSSVSSSRRTSPRMKVKALNQET